MLNAATLWTVSALLAWLVVNALIVAVYRRELWRRWSEPVFRYPVLVLESDDWGAGPLSQSVALRAIAELLSRHRDCTGRSPVLNAALVLAVPDGPAISTQGCYCHAALDDPRFASVLQTLRDGVARGVFALQLHGMEHFWPASLMTSGDTAVAAWLRQPVPASTEHLPSHLQSRWVDASTLPSSTLSALTIDEAVFAEVRAFERVIGVSPQVVVPPTFVWTQEVERAWVAAGVRFVVTPGWRSTQRNARGLPDGDEGPICNGQHAAGCTYLVRTDYFEPARGRGATYALRALSKAASEGQPCVLENHRDNFIFDTDQCQRSLVELDTLLAGALREHPGVRFFSTVELGQVLRDRDSQCLVLDWRERLPFIWQRLRHSGRPWRLMRRTGLAALGEVLVGIVGVRPAPPAGVATS